MFQLIGLDREWRGKKLNIDITQCLNNQAKLFNAGPNTSKKQGASAKMPHLPPEDIYFMSPV